MKHRNEAMKRVLGLALAFVMTIASIGFLPAAVEASNATAVQVVAGTNHTLVRLSNGEVWAWGSNARGQLGVNNNFNAVTNVPVRVPLNGSASYIAAGYLSSYAIVGGQLFAWGDNTHGQLGVSPGTAATPDNRRHTPTLVPNLPSVVQVVAGEAHVLVRSGGDVWAFGRNNLGQAVNNSNNSPVIPPVITVGSGNTNIRSISAGGNHSLSVSNDNRLWGAGNNAEFQVARSSSSVSIQQYFNWSTNEPMITSGVSSASAGGNFTLAIVSGNIFAYGLDDTNGRVGRFPSSTTAANDRRANGGIPLNDHFPTNNRTINHVAAGHNHAIAINTSGEVFTWGNNSQGQLGNGSVISTSAGTGFNPSLVQGLPHMTSAAAGGTHSVAIAQNGSLWAWGGNTSGQLGDGTNTSRHTPVQILSSNGIWTADQTANQNFTFDSSTGTITGYTGQLNNVVIPAQINGVNVTRVAASAFESRGLTGTLTFPSTLTYIGQRAFWGNSLTSVTVPNSVTHIGNYAFANIPTLTTAHFQHNDTTRLRRQADGGILGNNDIFLHASAALRLYRLVGANPAFVVPPYHGRNWNISGAGNELANFTFSLSGGVYTITQVTGTVPVNGAIIFPHTGPSGASVRTIGGSVFNNMTAANRNNITSIAFQSPSQVTTISTNAFFGLAGLRSAVIPASVQTIGSSAFAHNAALTEVHFEHADGSTLRLGQVFTDNTIFAGVPAGLRLTRPVGSNAATYVPFVSPAGTTRNWYASDGNIAWWTITPATGTGPVTITGFTGPSNLTTITLPATVGGRTVVNIGANVLTATNSPSLQEVIIPAGVHTFAANAISGPNLVRVHLLHDNAATIQNIPANAFGNPDTRNADFRIIFPSLSTGFTEPTWRGFPTQTDLGGAWETAEWTNLGIIITGFTGTNPTVQVPASVGGRPVRYIGPNVFVNNIYLRELIIPASVVFVFDNAVTNAPNLEIVYLRHTNANVFTNFPTTAFSGVHNNFRLYYPVDAQGFTTPTWNGFRAYPQRWTYTISGGQVTITGFEGAEEVVTIPSTIQGFPVRVIAAETFVSNQNITSIVVPDSVTTIQPYAVFNCRNLTSVVLQHTNAADITSFATNSFVGIAPNFRVMFPYGATGFTTPIWNGYVADPETGELILVYGEFEYTIRRVMGANNISRDEVVVTRYRGRTATVAIPATIHGMTVGGLGDVVFFNNQYVTQVTMPATIRTIGSNTFAGATNLTTIDIPASVTEIGHSAFMGASGLTRAIFRHTNGANVTFGENTFTNTASNFQISYPTGATGFATPMWRGFPAAPYGQTLPPGGNQPPPGGNQPPPEQPRSFPVRTTDNFPGVTGPPIMFRDGVGYVSLRAFAILIESDPATQILFNQPIAGWATVVGVHTNGSEIAIAVTSNDPRVSVTIDGVQHSEIDLATWAGPLSGRTRGQLRTRNEGGNIFLPFRAVSNIFGYDVAMLDSNTVQFTALPAN